MKKSSKRFKVSDPSLNVYGMRVSTQGIDTAGFLKNPVCLLNHDYDKIMGSWTELQVNGDEMSAVPVIDDEDPEAKLYGDKIERDLLNGASIGIIPLAVEGDLITKSELLEISLTPVPANRNALVIYSAKGVKLSPKEAKAYMLSVQSTETVKTEKIIMNEKLRLALMALCVQSGLTLQLTAETPEADMIGAIEKVGAKLTSLNLSVLTLSGENKKFKEDAAAANLKANTDMVDKAIADKVITADLRDGYLQLAAADPELARKTLEGLKPVQLSVIPGLATASAAAAVSADKENWTFDDYAEKEPMTLSAMETTDNERFQKLYSAKVANMKATGAIA